MRTFVVANVPKKSANVIHIPVSDERWVIISSVHKLKDLLFDLMWESKLLESLLLSALPLHHP